MKPALPLVFLLAFTVQCRGEYLELTVSPENISNFGWSMVIGGGTGEMVRFTFEVQSYDHDFSDYFGAMLVVRDSDGREVTRSQWGYYVDTKEQSAFDRAINSVWFDIRKDLISTSEFKVTWFKAGEFTFALDEFVAKSAGKAENSSNPES